MAKNVWFIIGMALVAFAIFRFCMKDPAQPLPGKDSGAAVSSGDATASDISPSLPAPPSSNSGSTLAPNQTTNEPSLAGAGSGATPANSMTGILTPQQIRSQLLADAQRPIFEAARGATEVPDERSDPETAKPEFISTAAGYVNWKQSGKVTKISIGRWASPKELQPLPYHIHLEVEDPASGEEHEFDSDKSTLKASMLGDPHLLLLEAGTSYVFRARWLTNPEVNVFGRKRKGVVGQVFQTPAEGGAEVGRFFAIDWLVSTNPSAWPRLDEIRPMIEFGN